MKDRASIRQDHARDTVRYVALRERLAAAGCFEPSRVTDVGNILLVSACAGAGFAVLLTDPSWITRLAALVAVAFAIVQAGFLGHDACHRLLSRRAWLSATWGHIFLTGLGGISYSHFCSFHRGHHAESLRGTSAGPELTEGDSRSQASAVRWGRILLGWALVSLRGLTLKVDTLRYVGANLPATRVDAIVLALHLLVWIVAPALTLGAPDAVLNYLVFTTLAGPYAGIVFLANHDADTGGRRDLPFLRRLLADTRNLGDTRWDDLVFGGINHHVEHHLYPAIPRARLRRARTIVRDFCTREDLPYREVPSRRAVRLISTRFAEGDR